MGEINSLWALTQTGEGDDWLDRMRRLREARDIGAVAFPAAGSATDRANISPALHAVEVRAGRIADAILAAADGQTDIAAAVAGVLTSDARTGSTRFPLRNYCSTVAKEFRAAVVRTAPTELGGHPTFASAYELAEELIRRGLQQAPAELAADLRVVLFQRRKKKSLSEKDLIQDPHPGQRQSGFLYRWEVALPLLCAHFGAPDVV